MKARRKGGYYTSWTRDIVAALSKLFLMKFFPEFMWKYSIYKILNKMSPIFHSFISLKYKFCFFENIFDLFEALAHILRKREEKIPLAFFMMKNLFHLNPQNMALRRMIIKNSVSSYSSCKTKNIMKFHSVH